MEPLRDRDEVFTPPTSSPPRTSSRHSEDDRNGPRCECRRRAEPRGATREDGSDEELEPVVVSEVRGIRVFLLLPAVITAIFPKESSLARRLECAVDEANDTPLPPPPPKTAIFVEDKDKNEEELDGLLLFSRTSSCREGIGLRDLPVATG